jgi:hypothetical protein
VTGEKNQPDRTTQETSVPTAPPRTAPHETAPQETVPPGTVPPGTGAPRTRAPATGPSAPQAAPADDPAALAERVAAAVTAHPSVARLHGGPFGVIATHLPGRRLVGVRIGVGAEPVELGVVLHVDRPIPQVVPVLRRQVSRLCGGAAVDITVADLELPAELAALLERAP